MEINFIELRKKEATRCRVCAVLHRAQEPGFKYFIVEELNPEDPNNRFHTISRFNGEYRKCGAFKCQNMDGSLTQFILDVEDASPMEKVSYMCEEFVVESLNVHNSLDCTTIQPTDHLTEVSRGKPDVSIHTSVVFRSNKSEPTPTEA